MIDPEVKTEMEVLETRVLERMERMERMETTLRQWAVRIETQLKMQQVRTTGLTERMAMVEERLDTLEGKSA